MSSVDYQIRQAVKALLVSAAIPGISTTSIKIRMLTKATKGIDQFPVVVISPYATIGDKPADFEGGRDRDYRVRIAIIDAMAGDTETNDDLYSGWIEAALNAIVVDFNGFAATTLPGIDRNWEINSEAVNTFDDSKIENGFFAFQNLVMRFSLQ